MKNSKKWLVIVLAVVILGTVAVGVAVANNSTTYSQSPYQTFLGNLATALGISQAKLTTGLQQAYTQTVNQEVASGKITQQQADKILTRISNGQPLPGLMGMGFGNRQSVAGRVYGKHDPGMGNFMIIKPLASALGITSKVLMADLHSGQTIAALAAAKGTTVAELQSTILGSIQTQLTSAVSSGKMTQTQETQIYNKLETSINSGDWITQLQKMCQGGFQQPGGQPVTP
jgi:guanyl-specific ribonuclease Sa